MNYISSVWLKSYNCVNQTASLNDKQKATAFLNCKYNKVEKTITLKGSKFHQAVSFRFIYTASDRLFEDATFPQLTIVSDAMSTVT